MVVAKIKEGKEENRTNEGQKEGLRTRCGPLGRTNSTWLAQFPHIGQAQGSKKHIKKSQRAGGLSLSLSCMLAWLPLTLSSASFGLACHQP